MSVQEIDVARCTDCGAQVTLAKNKFGGLIAVCDCGEFTNVKVDSKLPEAWL